MICIGGNPFSCSAENLMGSFNLDTWSLVLTTFWTISLILVFLTLFFLFGSFIIWFLDSGLYHFSIWFFCFPFSIPMSFSFLQNSLMVHFFKFTFLILLLSFWKILLLCLKFKQLFLSLVFCSLNFFYVDGILFSFMVLIDYLGIILLLVIASESWQFGSPRNLVGF